MRDAEGHYRKGKLIRRNGYLKKGISATIDIRVHDAISYQVLTSKDLTQSQLLEEALIFWLKHAKGIEEDGNGKFRGPGYNGESSPCDSGRSTEPCESDGTCL